MKRYLLKRLLLIVPTLFGITLVCFGLFQIVPGGPVEEYLVKVRQASVASGGDTSRALDTDEIENIKKYFGFDKPVHIRYLLWVKNVLTLDLGESYSHNEPVWDVIVSKFPISIFFGLTSFILSYLICIPLGLYKAIYNLTRFDKWSSIFIFSGYVIPGYALGTLLIILFCGGTFLDIFPLSNIISDNFESLSVTGKITDFLHHMILPMICYMAGEFAFLTMLFKNSLLEEINKDYIRTAILKGSTLNKAIWKHAFRNGLIPIATRIGEIFTVMFAGALLIEKVFDIDGMGLLSYNAILARDYNLVMGIIFLSSIMTLLGRLFADVMYVVVDPRIDFK
ncbi:MAG: ABC transporter permease subunit [Flavobacteriales bacterium]|nr:ABC transporter permease subunit [Flavobacteriales bacterium]